jgi:hypothetical protein
MASTWDWTGKSKVATATSLAGAASPDTGQPLDISDHEMVVYSIYIDASTYNMTGSDVYQIFKVGAGFSAVRFIVNVATAEGSSDTLDIGDGSSSTRYDTNIDLNSTATTGSAPDAYFVYTAADTIDIIPSATQNASKFTVTMIGCYNKIS